MKPRVSNSVNQRPLLDTIFCPEKQTKEMYHWINVESNNCRSGTKPGCNSIVITFQCKTINEFIQMIYCTILVYKLVNLSLQKILCLIDKENNKWITTSKLFSGDKHLLYVRINIKIELAANSVLSQWSAAEGP